MHTPLPQDCASGIKQQYLYGNILNKCKEGKLRDTSTIEDYTFWELNNLVSSRCLLIPFKTSLYELP